MVGRQRYGFCSLLKGRIAHLFLSRGGRKLNGGAVRYVGSHSNAKLVLRAPALFLVFLVLLPIVPALARDMTVFRCEHASKFSSLQEAEAEAGRLEQLYPGWPITSLESVEGDDVAFGIRIGCFPSYDEAENARDICSSSEVQVKVSCLSVNTEQAETLGMEVKDTLHHEYLSRSRPHLGYAEAELVQEATALESQARNEDDRNAAWELREQATPYWVELLLSYPNGPHAPWANYCLGYHYMETYYRDREVRRLAGARRASATEEAEVSAALDQFELVCRAYPDYVEAATAAYYVTSMIRAQIELGHYKEIECDHLVSMERALDAYEVFLNQYPEHYYAGRAMMLKGETLFRLAKMGKRSFEDALLAMGEVIAATDKVRPFELSRTMMMMGEIEEYFMKDPQAALDVFAQIDTGSEQDVTTACTTLYMMANANVNLGNWSEAVDLFEEILARFDNDDGFKGIDLHPICLYEMGDCLIKMGEWDAAYENFTRLKNEWPDDVRAVNYDKMLNWIALERGKANAE